MKNLDVKIAILGFVLQTAVMILGVGTQFGSLKGDLRLMKNDLQGDINMLRKDMQSENQFQNYRLGLLESKKPEDTPP